MGVPLTANAMTEANSHTLITLGVGLVRSVYAWQGMHTSNAHRCGVGSRMTKRPLVRGVGVCVHAIMAIVICHHKPPPITTIVQMCLASCSFSTTAPHLCRSYRLPHLVLTTTHRPPRIGQIVCLS
jgi:hypothetical protein